MDFVIQTNEGHYYVYCCVNTDGTIHVVDMVKAEVTGTEVVIDFGTPWDQVERNIAKYGDEVVKEAKRKLCASK